jgi:hypothetical protein
MFRLIGMIVVAIAIYVYLTYCDSYQSKVYVCSDTDLPPDVRQKCRQLVKQPKMDENGCVVQQTRNGDIKTCG